MEAASMSALRGWLRKRSRRQKYIICIAALTGIMVVTLSLTVYAFSDEINDMTRPDLSKHVSNKPCAVLPSDTDELHAECPGELKCAQGSPDPDNYGFDEGRIGADVIEPRCVTPTYIHRHCGIYEGWGRTDVYPPHVNGCGKLSLGPHEYALGLLKTDNLSERIFNMDANGEEMIRRHGLKLAREEPEIQEVAKKPNLSLSYWWTGEELTIGFENTSFDRSNNDTLEIIPTRSNNPEQIAFRYEGKVYNTSYIVGPGGPLNFSLDGEKITVVRDGDDQDGDGEKGVDLAHRYDFTAYRLVWNNDVLLDKTVARIIHRKKSWNVSYPSFN